MTRDLLSKLVFTCALRHEMPHFNASQNGRNDASKDGAHRDDDARRPRDDAGVDSTWGVRAATGARGVETDDGKGGIV